MSKYTIPQQASIGHVHLRVADLQRALAFYETLLGFEITTWYGDQAVFLSAGGYHHHIALNTWGGPGLPPAPVGHTGLYHFAILLPTRRDFASLTKRIVDHGYPLQGAVDHGVSQAVYLSDPDGNGVELAWDRPQDQWPLNPDGELAMTTLGLDLEAMWRDELSPPADE